MAPLGQAFAQMRHPLHLASFTRGAEPGAMSCAMLSDPEGQHATHHPQPVQACSSTNAMGRSDRSRNRILAPRPSKIASERQATPHAPQSMHRLAMMR